MDYALGAEPGRYAVTGYDAQLVGPGLAVLGVAARALVEHTPAPGHDLPLDVRDPVAVEISAAVALVALVVGARELTARLR